MFWKQQSTKKVSIGSVMTKDPIFIELQHHLTTAKRLMNQNNIRHLPVIQDNEIVGVLSDRDVRLATSIFKNCRDQDIQIKDFCLCEPYVEKESTSVKKVLKNMLKRKIGSVLIEKNGKLTGIFTMDDAGKCLLKVLNRPHNGIAL